MFKLHSPLPMYKEIMKRNVDVLKLPASKREWQMTEASHFEDMPGLDHKLNTSHGKIHCDPAVMLRVNDGNQVHILFYTTCATYEGDGEEMHPHSGY